MSTIAKAQRHDWEVVDGVLCVVVSGQDKVDHKTKIAIPAEALLVMASGARQRLLAQQTQTERGPVAGQWSYVRFHRVQTMNVGVTDDQAVGLILDHTLDTEMALSIQPDHALELGKKLETAARAAGGTPTRN